MKKLLGYLSASVLIVGCLSPILTITSANYTYYGFKMSPCLVSMFATLLIIYFITKYNLKYIIINYIIIAVSTAILIYQTSYYCQLYPSGINIGFGLYIIISGMILMLIYILIMAFTKRKIKKKL
ncbi:MAG: hypothetical protein Q4G04_05035 [bacterium]|nr:hypothetical protein [bacterium]